MMNMVPYNVMGLTCHRVCATGQNQCVRHCFGDFAPWLQLWGRSQTFHALLEFYAFVCLECDGEEVGVIQRNQEEAVWPGYQGML